MRTRLAVLGLAFAVVACGDDSGGAASDVGNDGGRDLAAGDAQSDQGVDDVEADGAADAVLDPLPDRPGDALDQPAEDAFDSADLSEDGVDVAETDGAADADTEGPAGDPDLDVDADLFISPFPNLIDFIALAPDVEDRYYLVAGTDGDEDVVELVLTVFSTAGASDVTFPDAGGTLELTAPAAGTFQIALWVPWEDSSEHGTYSARVIDAAEQESNRISSVVPEPAGQLGERCGQAHDHVDWMTCDTDLFCDLDALSRFLGRCQPDGGSAPVLSAAVVIELLPSDDGRCDAEGARPDGLLVRLTGTSDVPVRTALFQGLLWRSPTLVSTAAFTLDVVVCLDLDDDPPPIADMVVRDLALRDSNPVDVAVALAGAPAATFTMGSPAEESDRQDDETQHEVTLTRDLIVGRYELTQLEWQALMGNNPSVGGACGLDCPVENINWWEALAAANARSTVEGLDLCYQLDGCTGSAGVDLACTDVTVLTDSGAPYDCTGYRLPTESEWEYVARAGSVAATYGAIDDIAWHADNGGPAPQPVGTKEPNAWGLHDTLGNVSEWTWDRYDAYPGGPITDPEGGTGDAGRVLRGGSAADAPGTPLRAAYRDEVAPDTRSGVIGLRLVRTAP